MAYTDYEVTVLEAWKGPVARREKLVVRVPGGILADGTGVSIGGMPNLDPGRDMLLFLGRGGPPLWKDRWSLQLPSNPSLLIRGRFYGQFSPGLPRRVFRRLVSDILASAHRDSLLVLGGRDSLPPGCGRIRGRIIGPSPGRDVLSLLRVPRLRLVITSEPRGAFELPPLPSGKYRVEVIPMGGQARHFTVQVRAGQVDSVTVTTRTSRVRWPRD